MDNTYQQVVNAARKLSSSDLKRLAVHFAISAAKREHDPSVVAQIASDIFNARGSVGVVDERGDAAGGSNGRS
jgi:hypothetical protein